MPYAIQTIKCKWCKKEFEHNVNPRAYCPVTNCPDCNSAAGWRRRHPDYYREYYKQHNSAAAKKVVMRELDKLRAQVYKLKQKNNGLRPGKE